MGYVYCPTCQPIRSKLIQVGPGTSARQLHLYCRHCKSEYVVDIDEGQCFESRSQ